MSDDWMSREDALHVERDEWKARAEKAEAERDEARACIADALSVLLDPATSGEHWSILPSIVENLRDERDAMKATVNDALEQLRHEEHLRTTAERAVAEAAERLDEFGACPTLADGVHAMRLRLVDARAGLVQYDERLAVERGRVKGTMAELRNCHDELVAARADAARLREALECFLRQCECAPDDMTEDAWTKARAALAGTSDEVKP